jgi:hypothetical protein
VFHWCYVNDLHTTHAVVCRVTTGGISAVKKSVTCAPQRAGKIRVFQNKKLEQVSFCEGGTPTLAATKVIKVEDAIEGASRVL